MKLVLYNEETNKEKVSIFAYRRALEDPIADDRRDYYTDKSAFSEAPWTEIRNNNGSHVESKPDENSHISCPLIMEAIYEQINPTAISAIPKRTRTVSPDQMSITLDDSVGEALSMQSDNNASDDASGSFKHKETALLQASVIEVSSGDIPKLCKEFNCSLNHIVEALYVHFHTKDSLECFAQFLERRQIPYSFSVANLGPLFAAP